MSMDGQSPNKLRRNAVGVAQVVFFVVGAAAWVRSRRTEIHAKLNRAFE